MNLIQNFYLDYKKQEIPFIGYKRSQFIDDNDYNLLVNLNDFDGYADTTSYYNLFYKLLANIDKVDVIKYSLYNLQCLAALDGSNLPRFEPLLVGLLDTSDSYVRMSSIKLLTIIYNLEDSTLDKLLSVILSQLNDDNELDFYTLILTQLLNHKQAKHFIYDHLDVLLKQLNNSNIQSNYNIIYSIWLLTFDKSLSARINSDYKIIPPLAQLARSSIKEKVVRLILAIFVNLLKHSKQSTLATFLALPIQPTLNNLSSRRWNDAELQTDLDTITEQLQSSFASISNWDEYSSELQSGLLRWSPVHTDDDFWKNQSGALLKDNNWGLNRLFSLLDSQDQQILHITLYDISQCLKFIHHAKTYVDSSSKQKIMELLQHPDPKIKYQALITTQLLISQPWN